MSKHNLRIPRSPPVSATDLLAQEWWREVVQHNLQNVK